MIRSARTFLLAAALAAVAVACLLSASAQENAQPLSVTITDKAIAFSPRTPSGGLYDVTIRNMSSGRRGVEMTGIDKCCSPYVRYSRILQPKKTETFRWFFPSGNTVIFRDLLRCEHAKRSCVIATFGGLKAALKFQ